MNLTNTAWLRELQVHIENLPPKQIQADAMIIMASKSELEQSSYDVIGNTLCQAAIQTGLYEVNANSSYVVPTPEGASKLLIAIGRRPDALTVKDVRLMMANAAKQAIKQKLKHVAVCVPQELLQAMDVQAFSHAIVEGLMLGAYQRVTYKKDAKPVHAIEKLTICGEGLTSEAWQQGALRGKAYAVGTTIARDLTNLPGNELVPNTLAEQALAMAELYGFEAHVLDETEIQAKGMGGLLGVGQGSANPPRMIVLKYQGKDQWEDVLGLVGKGITFDTGGISLKTAGGMEDMISDMGGAATVLGAMAVIGQLRPQANVLCVVPSAENMPSSTAMKPGDILTTYSGRTIEVLNTDAEGRLVLADGMTYAKELGAAKLIDVATLTGAAIVAFADVTTGAITNNDDFLAKLITSSKRTDEYLWQLPSHPEYWELLKSDVADVRNSCGRGGGTITAGLFVGTFADDLPWVHLDIAGTAYLSKSRGVDPKGGTGAMVRTIADVVLADELNS